MIEFIRIPLLVLKIILSAAVASLLGVLWISMLIFIFLSLASAKYREHYIETYYLDDKDTKYAKATRIISYTLGISIGIFASISINLLPYTIYETITKYISIAITITFLPYFICTQWLSSKAHNYHLYKDKE